MLSGSYSVSPETFTHWFWSSLKNLPFSYYNWGELMAIFLPLILSTFINWNSSERKSYRFFPLIYLFSHLSLTQGYLLYSLVNNPMLSILLFKLFQLWPLRALLGVGFCVSWHFLSFLNSPCPSPGINHFSVELTGHFIIALTKSVSSGNWQMLFLSIAYTTRSAYSN